MALTPSNMMPLGTTAPDFTLPDTVSGAHKQLAELAGPKGTVVAFICNHCPYVLHIEDTFAAIAREYETKGILFVAISANDAANYLADAPDKMRERAREKDFCFPYLYDESQQVAKAYDAACTPDLFLFDRELSLVYRGQFDDTRPNSDQQANGESLRAAMDALLDGASPLTEQQPSIGCNIKWKQAG